MNSTPARSTTTGVRASVTATWTSAFSRGAATMSRRPLASITVAPPWTTVVSNSVTSVLLCRLRTPEARRLEDDAERNEVIDHPRRVHDGSPQVAQTQQLPDDPDDDSGDKHGHGGQLGPDETPLGDLFTPGLGGDDEAEGPSEDDVADGCGHSFDPKREQRQAVLVAAPGPHPVAHHEEHQLVGQQVGHEERQEGGAVGLDRTDAEREEQ